ncbi:protein of unknown function (DUF397) [Micromonospora viridifaciens]|uniref:DUF397 domain-containing protein n=1 Tax=Micromonospora viridifaciens TaxID=1881 RepID=A0A1C4Y531_MICVI|nr:DUF397 domain-containing protein [Micromonospora viridifaciens]SCF15814.1 protein of unknown function (DUF397) [Micromonospora viridifaciens]
MTDLAGAAWRKSTRSGGNGGNCVEVATNLPGIVAVRDSKDSGGPALIFGPKIWGDFVNAVRTGKPARQP